MSAPAPHVAARWPGRLLNWVTSYFPLVLVAAAWELSVASGLVSDALLPRFSSVLSEAWRLAFAGSVLPHVLISLYRVGAGLGAAIVVGVLLGLWMSMWRPADLVGRAILSIIYPLPKSALMPLLVLMFGLASMSKIVLIFIGCLLPITVHALNGARGVDEKVLWSAQSLGAGALNLIFRVRLRAAMPEILAGIRMGIAFAFILLINAELIFGQDGLGYLISSTGALGSYDTMFVMILLVAAIGFLADMMFAAFSRRFLAWQA